MGTAMREHAVIVVTVPLGPHQAVQESQHVSVMERAAALLTTDVNAKAGGVDQTVR